VGGQDRSLSQKEAEPGEELRLERSSPYEALGSKDSISKWY